jgi:ABC-2 type transport system permease protein
VRAVIRIAVKDLKRSIRDRSAIALSVVAPLVLAFILSSVLGNADESSFTVNYAVVDRDGGHIARSFVDEVLGGMEEEGFAEIREVDSPARARRLIEGDDIGAAFVLPDGFSDAVQRGQAAEIQILGNPDSRISTEIARSIARGFASELNAVSLSIATVLSDGGGNQASPEELQEAAQNAAAPARVTNEVAGSREFDNKTFFAAGMSVFFLFFTAQFGAVSLLTERKEGTLARLLAAPLSTRSIIGGKALYGYVLGAGSMAILIVASTLLMDANWGNPAGVALLVAAGVFAAMGIQSVVTTLAKTDEQAAGYGSIVGVTLGLLGGTFFPLSQAPAFLQNLSYATPHSWLMRGFGDLSGGVGTIGDTLPALGALVAIGVVTGTVALLRSRHLVVVR